MGFDMLLEMRIPLKNVCVVLQVGARVKCLETKPGEIIWKDQQHQNVNSVEIYGMEWSEKLCLVHFPNGITEGWYCGAKSTKLQNKFPSEWFDQNYLFATISLVDNQSQSGEFRNINSQMSYLFRGWRRPGRRCRATYAGRWRAGRSLGGRRDACGGCPRWRSAFRTRDTGGWPSASWLSTCPQQERMEQGEQKQKDKVGQCLLPTPSTESNCCYFSNIVSLWELGRKGIGDFHTIQELMDYFLGHSSC